MAISQANVDSPPLKLYSQLILHYAKVTIKTCYHKQFTYWDLGSITANVIVGETEQD